MKTSWRRHSSSSSEDVFKTSSRRLNQENIITLVRRLQKMSSWRLQYVLVKTNIFVLAIRLQDVFKTFSRRLQKVLQKRPQDIFKTSSRRFAKISSRHFQDISSSSTVLVNTSSRRIQHDIESTPKTTIYRGIYLGHTTSTKFIVSLQNFQQIKISQVLVVHFTTPFRGCLQRRS